MPCIEGWPRPSLRVPYNEQVTGQEREEAQGRQQQSIGRCSGPAALLARDGDLSLCLARKESRSTRDHDTSRLPDKQGPEVVCKALNRGHKLHGVQNLRFGGHPPDYCRSFRIRSSGSAEEPGWNDDGLQQVRSNA